jgi:chemotaxis protein MotB
VLLFDLGSADIKPYGVEVLLKLGKLLAELDNDIMIQGHTCDLPINTREFPSNWELSTRRATNVTKFFIEKCGLKPEKLGATGFAEFKPLKPNDSEANRQQNRRIDIVIDKSN